MASTEETTPKTLRQGQTEDAERRTIGNREKALTNSDLSVKANGQNVPLESILITEELKRRPSRQPDYATENKTLVNLTEMLANSPRTVLQELADKILEVVHAGSAGISLLSKDDGGKRFFWPAIAGKWKPHIGGGTPRDFGPCGDVLDRNRSLLFRHVERRYTYFEPVVPPVQEALLIPFYIQGIAVGTIWAVAHDEHKFDAEDERMMTSLGKFASSAYQMLESLDALTVRAAEAKRTAGVSQLLSAIVDSSDDAIISKSLDGIITSWNRGAEHIFGYTPGEAIGNHITLIIPPDRRQEETSILARLRNGERIEHLETVRQRKDGTLRDVSLTISPVKEQDGRIIGASKIARDITDRKTFENELKTSEERMRNLAGDLEKQVQKRTQELERRNGEILARTEELRELSRRLLQSQDDERRRIARDLHDSAGQVITALALNLSNIKNQSEQSPDSLKTIEQSRGLLNQLSNEVRTLSYLLHPPLLDESGLPGAVNWYITGLAERSNINIELITPEGFGRLSEEIETAMFRIVQESLTNIHRHSGSKTAVIRLFRTSERVSLEVQDRGKGISPEKLAVIQNRGSGVGITGMRERVRHLGGSIDIQSDDAGTKLIVSLPLIPPALAAAS